MKQIYKASKFNIVSRTKERTIIYNTLYSSLTRLSNEEFEMFSNGIIHDKKLMQEFIRQGILVRDDSDELEQYNRYTYYANLYGKFMPHITITPTMECNAKCFYCYEEGVRCGKMHEKSIQSIIGFLETLDCSKGIGLTWFGGEPLLNQEWMDTFSNELKEVGIEFTAFMITNGSRIDDSVIKKMKNDWNIHNVQITLDGCFDEYMRRKAYIDENDTVYYKVLKSIGKMADYGISVQVRMNIDKNNRGSILQAVKDIAFLYKENNKVKCYPAFLTGSSEPLTEREKVEFVKQMIEFAKNKFDVNEYLYRLPRTKACYFNQKNAFSIDVNGNVYTCEHMLGHEEYSCGNICDTIKIKERELSGRRDECQKCVFLPKCQGGCWDSYRQSEVPCFTDKYIIMAYLELL